MAAEYWPATHGAHVVNPGADVKVPAAHSEHVYDKVPDPTVNEPGLHSALFAACAA